MRCVYIKVQLGVDSERLNHLDLDIQVHMQCSAALVILRKGGELSKIVLPLQHKFALL